ncbi:carboxymethylenebutenolidase [Cryobacterium mesophilum]|nr:dienelactone hydrolase family protein [Terrimesophilobacter mesophilus]MBB5632212.1 carboxymethylenebutenolidase [Terrimesophilobacter mesophilus]
MPMIQIPDSDLTAYRAEPHGEPKGAVIVIHEIWGLVDHIRSVADRYAAEGYLAVAPDILSDAGVSPSVGQELHNLAKNQDEATRMTAQPLMREKLTATREPAYGAWAISQLRRVVDYLETQPGVDGRIAVTGFCFGGSYAFALAAADPRVKAAAPFYGAPPEESDIASIACPIHAFYGGLDERLMDSLPAVSTAMADAGVDFEATVYEGARHAFFNDTNDLTYDAEAASDSWTQVLEFLEAELA